ncbi:conserved hypothetical protein (plasmid) [Trichormus variabilis ATCC 29413]|uniref:Uncharacterized protein n=2 Tax=Anabaena variabilis TaxID=264691 RepID=Q3M2G5_TRIV2|nr:MULTISPECIES: hypothetical protein [Nostocaceae]ABA24821.1 conserved hypothetical protein [Trichormus variabilis ATCC 29413]MBC1217989.1 hypothetical protein [Trichormus variabilis ARAD]MBC1259096.1 hypothetical protein [Trichormus variabilis V5]MBC1270640.1 hypothetical protein [Trichormus variabilis FSR]MBC1305494.1 hypothetical protein [Trichormus variabilis N2B]
MDIQNTLTLMIQAVVMGIVSLMVFDFVSGLWVVPLPPAGWQPPVIEQPTVSAVALQPTPQPQIEQSTPIIAFEEIPDPWNLEPQSSHHSAPAPAVIVPFPSLRLLPPVIAQEVQSTKRKSKGAKSSTPRKGASTPKRQSTKSRTLTA